MLTDPVATVANAPMPGVARFGGREARGVLEQVTLPAGAARVADGGFWVVVGEFEGTVRAWRFAEVHDRPVHDERADPPWAGPAPVDWTSSMDRGTYVRGVQAVRDAVREGEVYQVNLCRVLSAPCPPAPGGTAPSAEALHAVLAAGNPAPYAGLVHVPTAPEVEPVWVVTASPELFLSLRGGVLTSGPIKGTAATADGLTEKDRAENVMIADMVRNDLQRVCEPGTVEVTDLLAVEQHPGLVHLVTTVAGRLLSPRPSWADVLEATYPPASVSGAPKSSALRLIDELEPTPRGPYCGAVGWIDADRGEAELAVGIRTFWWTDDDGGTLRFGTGAGITWGSDPEGEWAETELKARRLVALASSGDEVREDPDRATHSRTRRRREPLTTEGARREQQPSGAGRRRVGRREPPRP